jgi:microcystin-dependent protein
MDTPYIGCVLPWTLDYAPEGFALCNGQTLTINQNAALFSIIGTAFGGNGSTTFMLPNLNGTFPMAQGQSAGTYPTGTRAGAKQATLNVANLPAHTHAVSGVTGTWPTSLPVGTTDTPTTATPTAGSYIAKPSINLFTTTAPNTPIAGLAVTTTQTFSATGSANPISLMPPYQAVTYIICISGYYPPRP